jgi:hypothetical protein
MSLEYQVDHDRRLVLCEAHGTLTAEDIFRYQQEVWSRTDVVGYDELVDMSDVDPSIVTSPAAMRELAQLAAGMDPLTGQSRFAIVAPQPALFGLGRMYGTYREMNDRSTKQVGVFRDRAEAAEWLARRA